MKEETELVGLLFRFALGFVFLSTSIPKLLSGDDFNKAVASYGLLPASLVGPVARWLPKVELVCAVALLMGLFVQGVSLALGVLLVVFAGAVAVNLARGREIDCGCYGLSTPRRITKALVARDLLLAAMAFAVFVQSPTALSLASWPADSGSSTSAIDALAMLVAAAFVMLIELLLSDAIRARRAARSFASTQGGAQVA